MSGGQLRVLIVDDDDLMRAGLRAVLSSDDSIDVIGEAADGREAVTLAADTTPDVVLMDVRMPQLDGIAATRELSETVPATRVLMLTTFEDDDYVFGALSAGASGFLLKRTRPEQLIEAIHTIAAGESLLSPSVTRTVIDQMSAAAPPDPAMVRRLQGLTARERDVLALVARGLSNVEIATKLYVEESTIKTHMKRILAKLDLRDRVQAVIVAYETGLVRPGGAR
ncbi:response regulator transcription factor [Actinoplanes sp. NBC_00393]|uniref:response regulator transcription factor n=1 Tax=Actinoplanes sp. NBC_00393 TaxID=2975953 RepID=UPI002E239B81